eukprot:gene31490-40897_t
MSIKLSAKWQLDAALLSRPVDLTALVTLSRASPDKLLQDNVLHRLVTVLLNEQNQKKSDKDTKLDVLNILANVAAGSKESHTEVRSALQGVSEWFDEYMAKEELTPGQEPEMYKAMVLLLARCWDYRLKTEDVLELTQGNRKISLCTVVGLLEDGETYSTELKQRQKPSQGKMGQWEHELVCHKYEKPLLLQICRLLRGFTHPGTYFEASTEDVEKFSHEMDTLLEITLRSTLVEKLSMALYDCLFEFEDLVDEQQEGKDGELSSKEYRRHLLMETLLIPRLVLPYLDKCVIHATVLNTRAEAYSDMLEGDCVAEMALHNPQLVKGISASLRTLVIASFRAPATQFVMTLLRRLNPTFQMLRASAFCRYHDYIFALLCILNVNMGALEYGSEDDDDHFAAVLLQQLSDIFHSMSGEKQADVCKRVMFSGALPIARDTASYAAIENEHFHDSRAEAKKAHAERMLLLRQSDNERNKENIENILEKQKEDLTSQPKQTAFQIADSKSSQPSSSSSSSSSSAELIFFESVCLSGKDKVQKDKDVQLALSLDVYASDVKSGALKKGFNFMPKGLVCPITHEPLEKSDLQPDVELKNKIKRYQIQQTSMRSNVSAEDDLYDF